MALIQAHELRVATPPASPASTTVTRAPATARYRAIDAPMIPAPTTMTWGVAVTKFLFVPPLPRTTRERVLKET